MAAERFSRLYTTLFTKALMDRFCQAKISRWGRVCAGGRRVVRLGELCGAGVRRMLLKSLQATYHALLPAFTTGFIGLCARWVGGWLGAGARASERESGGCRRLITAAIKPWLVLQPARVAQPRTALQMKEAKAPPTDRCHREEKRNFQMKGRDFICPLIKCRWLRRCQPRKLKWPSHLSLMRSALC